MRRFPQSLSSRLLFALTLISLITVLGLGIAAYISERNALTSEVQTRLGTIARLKEEQLIRWLEARKADLYFLSLNRSHRNYVMMISSPEVSSSRKLAYASEFRDNLSLLSETHPLYRRIEILDPDGRVIVSTDLGRPTGTIADSQAFQGVFKSVSGDYVSDIYRNPSTGQVQLTFGSVIYDQEQSLSNRSPNRIGAVIADVELSSSFFSLVNRWPNRGDTGEIILGREDKDKLLVLNTLRSVPSSELRLRYPKDTDKPSPLHRAILGGGGVTLDTDNNGVPVIAAYRPVSAGDIQWGLVVQMTQSEAFEPITRLGRQLLIIAIITCIIAWLSTYIIWRRIANPLSNLIDATEEVMRDNYAVDIRVTHDDEIGMLTRSFIQMVETLDRRKTELQMANKVVNDTALANTRLVGQLRTLNSELEAKVYERTKELSEANVKLTHLDQLKSKFISNVSHELRNPVASLKLYLSLLQKSNDQNRDRYVAGIANQIDWLGKLIENILDITQLERGVEEMEMTYVDLNDVIQQVIDIYIPIAEDASLALTSELPTLPVYISGSASKLTQMITNLLANAVNYTNEGSITIELRESSTDAILTIGDTGIGIDREDLPHLFERFYRGKNTHELEIRGTGLGLGIVQDIVDLHHGHIEVESKLGLGSRFMLFFPLSHPIGRKKKTQGAHRRNQFNPKGTLVDIWPTDEEEPSKHPK